MELSIHPYLSTVLRLRTDNFYRRLLSICTNLAEEATPAYPFPHLSATDNGTVRFEILQAVFLDDLGVSGYDAVSPSRCRQFAERETNNFSCNV